MLEILVKRAEDLSQEENTQLDETSNLAFAGLGSEDLCWSDSEWFVLGKLDGRIVSIVGILFRDIRVGDAMVSICGVGGVATHPDYQRQGFAGKLMQRAGEFMKNERKAAFGLLVCESKRIPFYGGFGWQPINSSMFFECRGEHRRYEGPVMVLMLSDQPWPEGDVDLQGGPW